MLFLCGIQSAHIENNYSLALVVVSNICSRSCPMEVRLPICTTTVRPLLNLHLQSHKVMLVKRFAKKTKKKTVAVLYQDVAFMCFWDASEMRPCCARCEPAALTLMAVICCRAANALQMSWCDLWVSLIPVVTGSKNIFRNVR